MTKKTSRLKYNMARNIKVIEFYGLPGCGKTTLMDLLLSSPRLRIGSIKEVMASYDKKTFFYKISHLPVKKWWLLMRFLWSLPNKRRNGRAYYIPLFYKSLAYSYSVFQSEYDLIVVDHGLVQQLGSILHVVGYQLSDKSLRQFAKFVNSLDETIEAYCHITSDLSLSRMRIRNRDGGRIDSVMNDTQAALQYLEKEQNLFDRVANVLSDTNPILDMERPTEELANEVVKIVAF